MWFLLQPEEPCPPTVSRCDSGSALPIYVALGITLLLNLACPIVMRRRGHSLKQIIGWSAALVLSSAVVVSLIAIATAAAYMTSHPT